MISGLYLITDSSRGEQLLSKVAAALRGGATVVQYRPKQIPADECRHTAEQIAQLCRTHGALFIVNDSPELARAVAADGVHLGQDDGPLERARDILGADKLIGLSTHNLDEALRAEAAGADYIGIGSVFPTRSKADTSLLGVERLAEVCRAVRIPAVAIGGIDVAGADQAIDAGAAAVAVMSGVMAAGRPTLAAREYSLLFNRFKPFPRGRVLTIAGSDSGGGAGVQADIKSATLLGSYASSVITALTAQNTLGVRSSLIIEPDFISEQLNAVLDDIGTDVVKTGMLGRADVVDRVAEILAQRSLLAVVDPVMIAKGGASLLDSSALDSLLQRLLPETYLLTPNLPEAAALTGIDATSVDQMIEAGRLLQQRGAQNVLVKGGHLSPEMDEATDVLLAGDQEIVLRSPRFDTPNTHGTGCTLAATVATFLAQGYPLKKAVARAKRFIGIAIEKSCPLGAGHGPVNHFAAAMQLLHEREEK